MIKNIYTIFTLATLMCATSCTDVDDTSAMGGVEGDTVTIFASTGLLESRITMGDRDNLGITMEWDDDSFEVCDSGGAVLGTLSNDGEGGDIFSGNFAMTDQTTYTAYYPSKTAVIGDLTQTVNGAYGTNMDDMILMEKEFVFDNGANIVFDHKVAIFEFKFSTETYGCAPAKLVYNDGTTDYTVTYTGEEDGGDSYTLYAVGNPVASGSRDISVTIYDTYYNTYVYTASPSKEHAAGYVYTYTLNDTDYTLSTVASGYMNYVFTDSGDVTDFYITTAASSDSKGSVAATADGMMSETTATRADLALRNPIINVTNYPILAIKCTFDGMAKFRLHMATYGNYNKNGGDTNYDGVTGEDSDIYYYDLSKEHVNGYITDPVMLDYLDWVTTYSASGDYTLVEWVKTFADVDALLEAYPKATGGATVGLLNYEFNTVDETYDWYVKSSSSGASVSATTDGLECTVNSSKRIDLYNNSGITVDTSKYPILAIRVYNHTGTSFRLHDSLIGSFNNVSSGDNSTDTITDGSYEVKYFNLKAGNFTSDSNNPFNTNGVYTFATGTNAGVGWVITQSSSTDELKVDWIKTFADVAALEAYLAE